MLRILLNIFYTLCLLIFIAVITVVIDRQLHIFFSWDAVESDTTETVADAPVREERLIESIDKSIDIVEEHVIGVVEQVVGEITTKADVEEPSTQSAATTDTTPIEDVQEVITPEPLTFFDSKDGELSVGGVVLNTNLERIEGELLQLVPDTLLHRAAEAKIADMVEHQYFEHVSPATGGDVSYLADLVGYEYIVVGENLAMGDFDDDEDLVQGWMDSPGHRANILNDRFTQIGVAVGRGMFEGRETWFAVQIFGRPLSMCDSPNVALGNQIANTEQEVDAMGEELEALKTEIESAKNKFTDAYRTRIEDYNALVAEYNPLIADLKAMIDTYNIQVRSFNVCIAE